MKKSITPDQIKQNNRILIYHYIYNNDAVSQQDIAYNLHLSRPTVTTNLTELENDGLIIKSGQIDSNYVGRKAAAYSIVPDFRVGIGVEILTDVLKIIIVDLYGRKIGRVVFDLPYTNAADYPETACKKILEFKNSLNIRDEQILGVGFAVQGLVSADQTTIIYGKILDCTGLSINAFKKYLPYPCCFFHDADSAAISEMWVSPQLQDAFYLSLSAHLGAAIISKGEILTGNHGHTSTIEHVQMKPDGPLCYCGNRGCMDTLCSLSALLNPKESADSFFEALRAGDANVISRWDEFLSNLAQAINLLHLIYDKDFVLGGHLARYLIEEDLTALHKKISQMTPFAEEQDFLFLSKMPKHNITIGAALPFIQTFLESLNVE